MSTWLVLVCDESTNIHETVQVDVPPGEGEKEEAEEAMVRALTFCFREKGWRRCVALSAREVTERDDLAIVRAVAEGCEEWD